MCGAKLNYGRTTKVLGSLKKLRWGKLIYPNTTMIVTRRSKILLEIHSLNINLACFFSIDINIQQQLN